VGDKINAGIYCLSPSILDRIQPRPTSIEKEVFPAVAADGRLYAMALEGYWMDVGQPKDYLTGGLGGLGAGAQRQGWGMGGVCWDTGPSPKRAVGWLLGLAGQRWPDALLPAIPNANRAVCCAPSSCSAGLALHLDAVRRKAPGQLAEGAHISGNAIIDETAKIGKDCLIGPNVAIGKL
jgi:mannose-1-phosphate guanylyltransferase